MKTQNQDKIFSHLLNIFEIVIFLIVSTWFWFGPRVKWQQNQIAFAYSKKVSLTDQSEVSLSAKKKEGTYSFTLKNTTDQVVKTQVRIDYQQEKMAEESCSPISPRHIHYHLMKEDEEDLTLRTLSMQGTILSVTLQPQETRKYNLKYFRDEDFFKKGQCFYGKATLSSQENI